MIENSDLKVGKNLIEQWVHQWGCSVSEAVLEPAFSYFHVPNIDGFIGYRVESGCAVTVGDPVCSPKEVPALALAFHQYCRNQNLDVIYMIVSERFAKWAIKNQCSVLIENGEELILNPQVDCKEGHRANRLRNKISHAVKEGIEIHEYFPLQEKLEHSIEHAAAKVAAHAPRSSDLFGPFEFLWKSNWQMLVLRCA